MTGMPFQNGGWRANAEGPGAHAEEGTTHVKTPPSAVSHRILRDRGKVLNRDRDIPGGHENTYAVKGDLTEPVSAFKELTGGISLSMVA